MTYFGDLHPYTYSNIDVVETNDGWIRFVPLYNRLSVGWLDAPHDFNRGTSPEWLPNALLQIIAGPNVNATRSFHRCTFCAGNPESLMTEAPYQSRPITLGHAEIRVPTRNKVMFAAPNLIWHYITTHQYLPPSEFIQAVEEYSESWLTKPSPWIPKEAEYLTFD